MAEYINRNAAIEICDKAYQERLRMLDFCGDTVAYNIAAEIKGIPDAEAAPVVHGHVVVNWLDDCHCSGYGESIDGTSRYCNWCGAVLDEPEKKEE